MKYYAVAVVLSNMLSVIKRYSLQLVFTLSLLLGLQLPNFLQQYELRLQGHFAEATMQLNKFQSLADHYFKGDLQALITQHRNSDVQVFQKEALLIEAQSLRVQQLQQQIELLKKPIWHRLWALSQQIKQPIFTETWLGYQANIVLNQQAILVGIVVAVLMMLCLETLFWLSKYCCFRLLAEGNKKTKKAARKVGL